MLSLLLTVFMMAPDSGLYPIYEYIHKTDVSFERISLFSNGKLIVHLAGSRGQDVLIEKDFSESQMVFYEDFLRTMDWRQVPTTGRFNLEPPGSEFTVRVNVRGDRHDVTAGALDPFPFPLSQLLILKDSIRAVMLDQVIQNHPLYLRPPGDGDYLTDMMGRRFEIISFNYNGREYRVQERPEHPVLSGTGSTEIYAFSLDELVGIFYGYSGSPPTTPSDYPGR